MKKRVVRLGVQPVFVLVLSVTPTAKFRFASKLGRRTMTQM
jgi:hypothetical protein